MIPWQQVRSQLANAVKDGAPPDRIADLRRELAAARAADALRRLMASDMPLTRSQRAELAAILVGEER